MKSPKLGLAAAMLAVGAAPCAAAQASYGPGNEERRISGFAGANIRLPLGGRTVAKPSARLQLTTVHNYQDRYSAAPARTHRSRGLELGLAAKKPALFMMGDNVARMQQKLGARGSTTTTLLIVGGVVLVGVAALALLDDDCSGSCDTEFAGQ